MWYSIIKSSSHSIKISPEDLFLADKRISKEEIPINYSQIILFKLYNNGLGEIYTNVDTCKIIIVSIEMINYQKLMDWLNQKEIKQVNDVFSANS